MKRAQYWGDQEGTPLGGQEGLVRVIRVICYRESEGYTTGVSGGHCTGRSEEHGTVGVRRAHYSGPGGYTTGGGQEGTPLEGSGEHTTGGLGGHRTVHCPSADPSQLSSLIHST